MRTIILDGISYNLVPSLQNLEDNKIKIKIEYPRIISFVETDNNDNIWELNYDDDLYHNTRIGYGVYDLHHMLYEDNCVDGGFIKIYQIVTNPYISLKLGDLVKVKNIDGKTCITDTKFCIDKFIVGEISDSPDYNPIYVSDEDGRYFINVNDVEKVVMKDIEKVFEVRVSEAENEKSEYPKILSFASADDFENIWNLNFTINKYINNHDFMSYSLISMLHDTNSGSVDNGNFIIYSVAKNKNEFFTIGDKIEGVNGKFSFDIDHFGYNQNHEILANSKTGLCAYITDIKKVMDIKEISEIKDYPKILSFLRKDVENHRMVLNLINNKYHYENEEHEYSLDEILHKHCSVDTGDFIIYEVQANSDTIFKIGDRVKYFEDNREWKIDHFFCREKDGVILARSLDCNDVEDVLTIRKVQPLFTTEDGVDIYVGDYFHAVQKSTFHIINDCYQYPMDRPDEWILFSSVEEAEKYAENHKKKFSVDDIKTVVDKFNNHEIWKYLGFEKYLKNEFGIDDI